MFFNGKSEMGATVPKKKMGGDSNLKAVFPKIAMAIYHSSLISGEGFKIKTEIGYYKKNLSKLSKEADEIRVIHSFHL